MTILHIRSSIRTLVHRLSFRNRYMHLRNTDVTIFCSNCVGGVIYHDLGLRFMSPTINLFMRPSDFVSFCSDLPKYLETELTELDTDKPYPCGCLDGIRIDFVHYKSFQEARAKWVERSKRVNLANCCAILVDRDGCSVDDIRAFDRLPIECKAILTSQRHEGVSCEVANRRWASSVQEQGVVDLCAYRSPLSASRWIDDFDYVELLNRAGGINGK